MSRAFTAAWLAGDAVANGFLPRAFSQPEARIAAVRRAASRSIEPAVMAALAAQEARRPWSAARAQNLELLARGAAVVVTGQQIGLLLGPLYTLHKAASAVADARALSLESGHPVVPLFWLQTEDHDFEEVRSTRLAGTHGVSTLALPDELDPAARVSVGTRRLGGDVAALLDQLGQSIAGPHAGEVMALLQRHYRPGARWADAFAEVLAELFAEHGLLIFDPRAEVTPELPRLAAPVHAFALGRAAEIESALSERSQALAAAGFEVQVPVRRGMALSCYAAGTSEPRQRLERAASAQWITRELDQPIMVEAALAESPERFTTTALLRPLLQDTWFPTAAYVGGPGELAYFAQLPPLYELAGREMPLAVPRARFTLVTATARRLGEQLGIPLTDAGLPRAELAERLAGHGADMALIEGHHQAIAAALTEGLADWQAEAERRGDGGFAKHARKTSEIMHGALDRLLDRSRRLALESDAITAERLTRLQAWLAPDGAPQERVLGFAGFAAQVGPGALIDRIVEHAAPFDGTPRMIDL